MLFEIFADSGCDIPVEMMKELNIHPVYFYVSFDGETYKKEKLEVNTTAYYKKMIDENAFPKTSLPSVQDYVDAFTPVLEEGKGIICICMSGKLSGSHQAAKTARDILLETYPKAHIKVIESKMCTVDEGLFVLEAVRMLPHTPDRPYTSSHRPFAASLLALEPIHILYYTPPSPTD